MKTAVFEYGKQSIKKWIENNRDCEKMVLVGNVPCDKLFGLNLMVKDFHPKEFDITDMHILDHEGNEDDEYVPYDADGKPSPLILKMLVNRKYCTRFVYNGGILTTPDGKVLLHQPDAKHIVVPAGIEIIGNFAFASYTKMRQIDLPAGLKEFGDYSFDNVVNLKELTMPDSVEKLGEGSFRYTEMDVIRVSDKIETYPPLCFRYCAIDKLPSSLKTVDDDNCFHFEDENIDIIEFPNGFEHLGSYALGYEFKEVRFPSTTKYIAEDFWYDFIIGPDELEKPAIVIDPKNPYFSVEGINNIVHKCVMDVETQKDFSRRAIGFVKSETERNYLLEKEIVLSPKEMINLVEMSPENSENHRKWFYWDLAQTTILNGQERIFLSYMIKKTNKVWNELHTACKTRKIAAFGVNYNDKEVLIGTYPHDFACMKDMMTTNALNKYDKVICRQYKKKDKTLKNELGQFELESDYSPINNVYYAEDYPAPEEVADMVDIYIDLPHPFEPGDIVKMPHYQEQYVVAEIFKPTKEQIESKYVDKYDMAVTVLPVKYTETVRECLKNGEKIPEDLFSQHEHFSFLSLEMVEKFNI